MINQFAEAIVRTFEKSGVLKEDRELYLYGAKVALQYLIVFPLIAIIAFILKIPYQVFIFLIPFMLLRSSMGGYHARKRAACAILSILLVIGVPYLIETYSFTFSPLILLLSLVVLSIIMITSIPGSTVHKKLTEKLRKIYRKKALLNFVFINLAAFILWCVGRHQEVTLIYSAMYCLVISVFFGNIQHLIDN